MYRVLITGTLHSVGIELRAGHRIPIRSFEFSHSDAHKRSMFLIRVGKELPDTAMQQLRQQPYITLVRRIVI